MRLLLSLVAVAACTDSHHIETSWQVSQYVPGEQWGYSVPCPNGWETARITAVDPARPDNPDVEDFACGDGYAVTNELPADSYVAHVEILDGTKVLASSPLTTVDVTSNNPILSATFFVDAGYIDIDWAPCPDPSASVVLAVTPIVPSTDFTEDDTFIACSAGYLLGGPYRQGAYSVTFSAGDYVETFPSIDVTAPAVTHLPRATP